MQARDSILVTAGPAWPTLVGVHLVVAAILVGAWWRASAPPTLRRSPVEVQALALDPAQLPAAVDDALHRWQRAARALPAADVTRAKSYLSLSASAAGMELVGSEWSATPAEGVAGVEQVRARLRVRGTLYDLPVFLDGLHRQSATVRVQRLAAAVAAGGAIEAWIDLAYHRPQAVDGDALQARVARTVPAADPAVVAALARAGEVATWRDFARHSEARAEAAAHTRERLARELPAALVALRADGGVVAWSEATGVVQRARVARP